MIPNVLPNWARLALSIATLLSYFPQFRRIREQEHVDGVSLYYVLFGLISATEQLTIGVFSTTALRRLPVFVNDPATTGDWLNFAQLVVVSHRVRNGNRFIVCLSYASRNPGRRGVVRATFAIYIVFIHGSLVPVALDAIFPNPRPEPRQFYRDIFAFFHFLGFLPLSSFLALAAIIPQALKILLRSEPRALSLRGMAVQAVVFALVAISWMIRVESPPQFGSWGDWYRLVGWPVVNNGLFAFVQGALLWIALWCPRDDGPDDGEEQPLLSA